MLEFLDGKINSGNSDTLDADKNWCQHGLFLRESSIDYVSIVIVSLLVGGKNTSTLIGGDSITTTDELNKLRTPKLLGCNKLDNSYIQLKYKAIK